MPLNGSTPPADLVEASHALGDPEYTILGDGNTSALAEQGTFWIKASGARLATVTASDFVRVRMHDVLSIVTRDHLPDAALKAELAACKVDGAAGPPPSIETVMHAALLELPGISAVGHTHPTAVNMLTCSDRFEEAFSGRIFPEEVVLCGPESLLIPYVDPGTELGRVIRARAREFFDRTGEPPRTIYMKNHGMIACGESTAAIKHITMMAVKAAKIRWGALAVGKLSLMSQADIDRMHRRPDVQYRKTVIARH